jgi:hypothetical protein
LALHGFAQDQVICHGALVDTYYAGAVHGSAYYKAIGFEPQQGLCHGYGAD